MNFWDQVFDSDSYRYGTAPNAFVRAQAQQLPPHSRVLVPGDGEGRNGVWLASQGHTVLSVDGSAVGLAKARRLAAQQGVHIATLHTDFADWTPAPASADALVLTYVHLPPALRQSLHQRLRQALVPGGWILIEAFHPGQLAYSSGGPRDLDMLTTLAQLRTDFGPALQEHLAFEGVVALSEGAGHNGQAHVVRWLAQTPQEPQA